MCFVAESSVRGVRNTGKLTLTGAGRRVPLGRDSIGKLDRFKACHDGLRVDPRSLFVFASWQGNKVQKR